MPRSYPAFGRKTWRIKQIRGWSLKFKRLSREREIGILTQRYQAVAKKNNTCVEYRIIDINPVPARQHTDQAEPCCRAKRRDN